MSGKFADARSVFHWAGIVAAAVLGVNAVGCAAGVTAAPEQDAGHWVTYLGAPSRAPSANETIAREPRLVWTVRTGKAPAGALALGDSVVVVQSSDRHLMVYRRETGQRVWRRKLHGRGATGPLVVEGRVYGASGDERGRVHAYALRSGERIWSREMGPIVDPMAVYGANLYAATRTGDVVALSRSGGDVVWQRRVSTRLSVGVTALGPYVLVAAEDSLHLLRRERGQPVVSRATPGTAIAAPAVAGDTLIFASPMGFVTGLDVHSLRTLWQVDVQDPVYGSPTVARDTVFAVTARGTLWAIPVRRPLEGQALELTSPVRAPPAPVTAGVLVVTLRGEIMHVVESNIPKWRTRVEAPVEQAPVVDGSMLFVVDGRGEMHAWR